MANFAGTSNFLWWYCSSTTDII